MNQRDREKLAEALSTAREMKTMSVGFLEREFETYDLLREHLPIARTEPGEGPMGPMGPSWFLTRYEDIAELLRSTDDFSSQSVDYPVRPWIPQAVDPPAHTGYRRILNPWFTADAMAKLEPHLQQFAETLVDAMLGEESFDFVAGFADPFPTRIFCELAGFPEEDYARIMDWKNGLMHLSDGHPSGNRVATERARGLGIEAGEDGTLPGDALNTIRAVIGMEIYAYFGEQLEARRQEPRDDLITKLLGARFEGKRPLTQEEMEDTLFLLFMAGLDTVTSVLGLIVKHFAENPEKRREFVGLMEEPRRVTEAVEELVRFHANVPLPRRVRRAVVFGGARMHEGDSVSCPTPSANRDAEAFERPHELIFDRSPNRHMGFGMGPHRCLGIHLARRELRIALQVFHRKLPEYELDPERSPTLYGGMKGVSSLWLRTGEAR